MAETFQDLITRGLEPADIAHLVRTKQLTRIRRGIYIRDVDLTPEQRHRELIEATVPELAKGSVLSHVSAAVLHDLPVPMTSLSRVHFSRAKASGRISRYAHRHGATLPRECTTVIDEFPVTGVERTAADLCRVLPYPDAVAVVDAALRKGVPAAALAEQLIPSSGGFATMRAMSTPAPTNRSSATRSGGRIGSASADPLRLLARTLPPTHSEAKSDPGGGVRVRSQPKPYPDPGDQTQEAKSRFRGRT